MAKAKKNSLVANINRRKKSGKSRSKSRSTVSSDSYENMEAGWPQSKAKRKPAPGRRDGRRKRAAPKPNGRAARAARNSVRPRRVADAT